MAVYGTWLDHHMVVSVHCMVACVQCASGDLQPVTGDLSPIHAVVLDTMKSDEWNGTGSMEN